MTDTIHAIYGASGCGRGVAPLLRAKHIYSSEKLFVFVDDGRSGQMVNGFPVWSYDAFVVAKARRRTVTIAIANSRIREELVIKCMRDGISFETIAAAQHVCMDNVEIGEGAIFSPFTTITSNIRIGRHFHCNIGSYVEHDCVLGDFVTFAPGVKCNGNVQIADHAYIGAGAILKQGTPDKPLIIGAGAIVGMGAVVTKDVAPGAVVVGNPAQPLVK